MTGYWVFQGQVSSLEDQQSYISKESQASLEEAKQNFQMELAKERCKMENLAKTLQDKEKKIEDLKFELTKNHGGNTQSSKSHVCIHVWKSLTITKIVFSERPASEREG